MLLPKKVTNTITPLLVKLKLKMKAIFSIIVSYDIILIFLPPPSFSLSTLLCLPERAPKTVVKINIPALILCRLYNMYTNIHNIYCRSAQFKDTHIKYTRTCILHDHKLLIQIRCSLDIYSTHTFNFYTLNFQPKK